MLQHASIKKNFFYQINAAYFDRVATKLKLRGHPLKAFASRTLICLNLNRTRVITAIFNIQKGRIRSYLLQKKCSDTNLSLHFQLLPIKQMNFYLIKLTCPE